MEVSLHGIHLHHCIADGSAGGKDDASSTGQFIHVAALHVEVGGLLGFALGNAAHVVHFCKCGQVFKVMRFIYKKPVNAQFFKGKHIILSALIVQLFELRLHGFFLPFQLFDTELPAHAVFCRHDHVHDFIQLLLQSGTLAL